MPKRKEPELTPAEQKKRFEALAREVGAQGSSPEQFKNTLKRVLAPTGRPARREAQKNRKR